MVVESVCFGADRPGYRIGRAHNCETWGEFCELIPSCSSVEEEHGQRWTVCNGPCKEPSDVQTKVMALGAAKVGGREGGKDSFLADTFKCLSHYFFPQLYMATAPESPCWTCVVGKGRIMCGPLVAILEGWGGGWPGAGRSGQA